MMAFSGWSFTCAGSVSMMMVLERSRLRQDKSYTC
jgi:hypothetical protein